MKQSFAFGIKTAYKSIIFYDKLSWFNQIEKFADNVDIFELICCLKTCSELNETVDFIAFSADNKLLYQHFRTITAQFHFAFCRVNIKSHKPWKWIA